MLLKHFYKVCDGRNQQSHTFANHMTGIDNQDRLMSTPQASKNLQEAASDPVGEASTGSSLQRASVLFVASVSSFIGASLLLASI
jgi:hypothetical protein